MYRSEEMVQGYTGKVGGSKGGWSAIHGSRKRTRGTDSAAKTRSSRWEHSSDTYICRATYDQQTACFTEESKLPGAKTVGREVGGLMLSVTGVVAGHQFMKVERNGDERVYN